MHEYYCSLVPNYRWGLLLPFLWLYFHDLTPETQFRHFLQDNLCRPCSLQKCSTNSTRRTWVRFLKWGYIYELKISDFLAYRLILFHNFQRVIWQSWFSCYVYTYSYYNSKLYFHFNDSNFLIFLWLSFSTTHTKIMFPQSQPWFD